jgi:hypothetical protein
MTRHLSRCLVVLGAFGALALAPACNADGDSKRNKPKTVEEAPVDDGPRNLDVARPAFQAKSSVQLSRSIEACVGAGAIKVTAPMITTPDGTNPAGFLTADFAVDADIVAVQAQLFDGSPEALRTGVRVDQVSLSYITALKNVANVVGSRCADGLVASPELCSCATEAEAKAMLGRCLTAVVDPSSPEVAALARDFAAACSKSKGSAIASMVASLAFAKIP